MSYTVDQLLLTSLLAAANALGVGMIVPQAVRLNRLRVIDGLSGSWVGVGLAMNLWWLSYAVQGRLWGLVPVSVGGAALYGVIACQYAAMGGRAAGRSLAVGALGLAMAPPAGPRARRVDRGRARHRLLLRPAVRAGRRGGRAVDRRQRHLAEHLDDGLDRGGHLVRLRELRRRSGTRGRWRWWCGHGHGDPGQAGRRSARPVPTDAIDQWEVPLTAVGDRRLLSRAPPVDARLAQAGRSPISVTRSTRRRHPP